MNTEAMPKAVPAAAASSTLCSTTRCIRCAARNSAATAAPVTTNSRLRSPSASGCSARPAPPVSASSPASPTAASTAPRHAAAPARRRTKTAAIGSANTMVRAPSGWTRLSGPYASATTCSSAPRPFSPTATHQPPRRSGAYRRSGVLAATLSWTIAPPAYAMADTRQSRTDSASALISSTMPDPSALFLRPQVVTSHTPDVVREYAAWPFHQHSATPIVPHGHHVDPYGDGLFAMREAPDLGFGSGRRGSVQFPF
ncbi:hypothetical protein ADK93_10880 [Streptomyces sp. XY58]|nr:hypothetical protein ADK93_10880 [Streptomyces sp. XY58]